MSQDIDPAMLGDRLRAVRHARGLTLQDVAKETSLTVATLSRIERYTPKSVNSDTLLTLSDWLGTEVRFLKRAPVPVRRGRKALTCTPDIVEHYLRADKNLRPKTALALANLFRNLYEQLAEPANNK